MNAPADPHARLRVAIYGPDGRPRALMAGTLATIQANTPPGGRWEAVPSHVRRLVDVRIPSQG
jgi:hypothetical protein